MSLPKWPSCGARPPVEVAPEVLENADMSGALIYDQYRGKASCRQAERQAPAALGRARLGSAGLGADMGRLHTADGARRNLLLFSSPRTRAKRIDTVLWEALR
jgi:hypothetical protein